MEPVYRTVIGVARGALRRPGAQDHDQRPRERAAARWRGHGDQPHRLLRLHLCRAGRGPRSGAYVRFMAKKSIWSNPVAGPLMAGMQHIPVDRDAGAEVVRDAAVGRCGAARSSGCSPRRPSRGPSSSRSSSPARRGWRRRPGCRCCRRRSGARSGCGPRASPSAWGGTGSRCASRSAPPSLVGARRGRRRGDRADARRRCRPSCDADQAAYPAWPEAERAPAAGPARRHRADPRGGRRARPRRPRQAGPQPATPGAMSPRAASLRTP